MWLMSDWCRDASHKGDLPNFGKQDKMELL